MSESRMMKDLSLDDRDSSSSSSSNQPSPKPKSKKTRQEDSLYSTVSGGKVSLQQLVSDWLEEYKVEKDSAMVRLVQFVVSASGCSGQVTQEMMETMEQGEMINVLAEQFDMERPGAAGTYPVAGQGVAAKQLRGNLAQFFLQLVKQTQNSILYDQFLMDNLISLLTQLSDSQVRTFRHTATLSAMSLMTGLVSVWVTVSKVVQNSTKQLEREERKKSSQRDGSRMEVLINKLAEMEENQEETLKMLMYMFKSVFVHRYRDVVEDIRSLCLIELGVWLKECPTLFLEDSYLKYLGWPLHDKAGSVRLASLQSLLPLYSRRDMQDKLVLFTDKFKERLVSMILDKEMEVSVCAIQLLECLVGHQSNTLTDQHCEMVYELVYSSHSTVARAAGRFLQVKLFRPSLELGQVRTKRGKMRLPNTSVIRDMVQFFIESERPDFEAYLVDSLIDNPMVKDWECMTDLLVEEHGPEEDELDDSQETALIVLMVASIKQVVTGERPTGRDSSTGRRVQSAKENRQMALDREVMSTHFMATLPHLIHKYLPDQEKVSKLLAIPQFMKLEMFTTSRQERALEGLLKLLSEVVDKHTDEQVLGTAFKTLELLCNPQSSSYTRCNARRERMVEGVVRQFSESMDEYHSFVTGGLEPGQDELFSFELRLRKLCLLYKHHNVGQADIWEMMMEIVRRAEDCYKNDEEGWEPEEAIKSALLGCYYGLVWDRSTGWREGLMDRLDMFVTTCRGLVVHAQTSKLAEEAFISVCDLLVVFGQEGEAELLYRPSEEMAEELGRFLERHVFSEQERDNMEGQEEVLMEKLLRKRNLLTCYCKLVVMKLLPVKHFTLVLSNYLIFPQFGDIIKATLGEVRDSNRPLCARVMLMCLVENFNKTDMEADTDKLYEQRELARRMSLMLGLDGKRNREAMALIHREGIQMALGQGTKMMKLFVVLAEFSGKVLKQDRMVVVEFLDREMGRSNLEESEEVIIYRNSLVGGKGAAADE
eukprot:GFUD01001359.1.p1 GENE.GFUD01001359.1~~GFUD01001359.1.p1  ORF type:complete len:991 (+),score=345.98 GFUD01001359.1:84-3056(+)